MLKIKYEFTALQPIHTGSDENTGTERKLRREKVLLKYPVKIKSKFETVEQRREAVINILFHVWKCIDFESFSKMRLMNIWDEYSSKVLAATSVRTKEQFLNILTAKMGIRSLANDYSELITELLSRFNDDEFLQIVRDELQYLILKLRIETKKKDRDTKSLSMFENKEQEFVNVEFVKSFDSIPYISGNSIRGYLRRLVMYDFCKQTGITSLDKHLYHQLFTGGNITDSTGKESLENREKFIAMCPMIGLLGSAIGNQTIHGDLKVGGARPQCIEHGTGELSFWELIETKFQTRLDSSKTEEDIEIIGSETGKPAPTTQMIYQYETFIVGTKFNSSFAVMSENELTISAFYRMIELFKESNYIAGNSARDSGMIDINIDIPENASKLYLDYLDSYKDEIQKYFKTKDVLALAGA